MSDNAKEIFADNLKRYIDSKSFIGCLKQHTNVTILSAHRYFV